MTSAPGLPRPVKAGLGVLLDRVVGEPPTPVHPVALFSRAMGITERGIYSDKRLAGAVHAAIGTALGAGGGALVRSTTVATEIAVGGGALPLAATDVASALAEGDEVRARDLLPALVGRDRSGLDAAEIARAAVESVAENTEDAVVAPALWAALAGAPGVLPGGAWVPGGQHHGRHGRSPFAPLLEPWLG
ncbi:MAG TPA: cobalamin biosynthesis protein [Acidimicrobiales bacterium]|nr:cobalamin biosynthesis protein [Acidimicrobiales bacterium]